MRHRCMVLGVAVLTTSVVAALATPASPIGTAAARACVADVVYRAPARGTSGPISFADATDEWSATVPLRGMLAHAIAAEDVNDDGWVDVFVGTFADRPEAEYAKRGASGPSPDRLLLGGAEGFEVEDSFPGARGRTSGAAFSDLDGDGDPDLVVARNVRDDERGRAPTEVLRNVGGGAFERAATLAQPIGARSIGLLDYDRDGRTDLFVVEDRWAGGSSVLYRNEGGFRFRDVTGDAGLPRDVAGFGVSTADLDGDELPDLFVSGANRVFYLGEDGRFEERGSDAFQWAEYGPEDDPGGVAAGDLDGDGRTDLVVGQHYGSTVDFGRHVPIRVYLNRLGASPRHPDFVELTGAAGIDGLPTRAPHVEIADFDADGRPDVLVGVETAAGMPLVYRNLGGRGTALRFEAIGTTGPERYWPSGVVADFDRDGRLDVVLADFDAGRSSLVLRNDGASGHWTAIAAPTGSVVELISGTRTVAVRTVDGSSGFGSSEPSVAWFGVPERGKHTVSVTLSTGRTERVAARRDALTRLQC